MLVSAHRQAFFVVIFRTSSALMTLRSRWKLGPHSFKVLLLWSRYITVVGDFGTRLMKALTMKMDGERLWLRQKTPGQATSYGLAFLKGPVTASRRSQPIGSEYFSRWLTGEFEFPASFWFDLNEIIRFTWWIWILFPFNNREESKGKYSEAVLNRIVSVGNINRLRLSASTLVLARPSILANEHLLAS